MAKKQRRSSRKTTRQQPEQKKTPVWVWFALSAVASILLVVGLFYLGNQGPTRAGGNIEGVEFLPDPGAGHVEGDITYAQDVPAGGPHNPIWQNCGIYDEPVRPENVIHSLEHGAVWVAYQLDLPEAQVEILRDLVRQERRNQGEPMIVLAPKEDLDVPIVATAWRVQLKLDDASDERLPTFLGTYQRGPFTPEPGASCVNGVGEPTG